MHGMILALNYNCEIIPYVISPKIQSFKNEILEPRVDLSTLRRKINLTINEITSAYYDRDPK